MLGNSKMAAALPLADGALQDDLLAENLLDHAALHGADGGVLLCDVEVGAGEQPEAVALGLELDRDAAGLKCVAQRRQPLREICPRNLPAILLGQARADSVQ